MIPLFNTLDFQNAKSNDILPLKCKNCNEIFYKEKRRIKDAMNPNLLESYDYCSKKCSDLKKITKQKINCTNCNVEFFKKPSHIKRSINHFCSSSCAASYNNKHKLTGNRRSKLEIWLEEQLTNLYPNLDIHYNEKSVINSELDIYIPSLNLAFELNGIFHYEPIYGTNKLQKIQENDISKSKACHDAKIDLCVIDTSKQKKFSLKTSKIYLDIIHNIIKER